MLQRFSPGEHYVQGHDYKIDAPRIFLLSRARFLIAQYYQQKYHTKIIFLDSFSQVQESLAQEKEEYLARIASVMSLVICLIILSP